MSLNNIFKVIETTKKKEFNFFKIKKIIKYK